MNGMEWDWMEWDGMGSETNERTRERAAPLRWVGGWSLEVSGRVGDGMERLLDGDGGEDLELDLKVELEIDVGDRRRSECRR